MRYVVGPLAEFPPGTRRIVKAGVREVGVFRVGDAFYAIRNRCPHHGAPLCEGPLSHKLVAAAPGELAIDEGAPLIVCPWHGWQWDAVTGEAYAPGDPKIRAYGVTVQEGAELNAEPGDVGFVAETYAVRVEDEYVVLEM